MNKSSANWLPFLLLLSQFFYCCGTLSRRPVDRSSRSAYRNSGAPASKNASTRPSSRTNPPGTYTRTNSRQKLSYPAEISGVIETARTYTGTPYRSGGNDKSGIDCSGLICAVYSAQGYKVPRISWQQSEYGSEVKSIKEIRPGDWLFFVPDSGTEGYVSHAGIVTEVSGDNEIIFIHASSSRGVREDNLFSTYFKGRFVKAMRPF